MDGVIVLSNRPESPQSKLLKICFTPVSGSLGDVLPAGSEMIMSRLEDDGTYTHLGHYNKRFHTLVISDSKGHRIGYILTDVPTQLYSQVEGILSNSRSSPRELYEWSDQTGFVADDKRAQHLSHTG